MAPLILPRTKSTVPASSLIEVTQTSKEGAQGILSALPTWAGHCFSSFEHTVDGTFLLSLRLNVTCDLGQRDASKSSRDHLWRKLSEPMRDALVPFTCLSEA